MIFCCQCCCYQSLNLGSWSRIVHRLTMQGQGSPVYNHDACKSNRHSHAVWARTEPPHQAANLMARQAVRPCPNSKWFFYIYLPASPCNLATSSTWILDIGPPPTLPHLTCKGQRSPVGHSSCLILWLLLL